MEKAENIPRLAPYSVRAWARSKGLCPVTLTYSSERKQWEAHFDDRVVMRVACVTVSQKHSGEELIKHWASAAFDVDEWVRIQGMGNALVPLAVAQEIKRLKPTLRIYYKRQKS